MADPDPQAIKLLLVELRDINKDTRRSAVVRLGMQGGDQALRALMDVVSNPYEDLIVRGKAAQMLGMMADGRAVDPLIKALDAPGYQTQLYAAEALGKIGNPRAITPLVKVANDRTRDRVRAAARNALRLLGHSEGESAAANPEPDPDPQRILEEI